MPLDLEKQINTVLDIHTDLIYDASTSSFSGSLEVAQNDFYEVKVDVSTFPDRFPIVYEVGERIPQKIDRHKYTDSNSCCLTTYAKAQILLKTEITSLPVFISQIAIPYFQNNSYYEINKRYLHGEYAHGPFGIIEGYQEILGVKNVRVILQVINDRIEGRKIKIRDMCYCNSALTLKKCGKHRVYYKRFRLIDKDILKNDSLGIRKLIQLYDEHQKRHTS